MALFDFILNLAALLLWLSWCSRHLDPWSKRTPATLVGTVKRAEPVSPKGWLLLSALGSLLVVRALFYRQVGSAVGWTPKLDLGFVVLAFRSDQMGPVFLYSFLSFARVLLVYYFWLLTLVLINWRVPEPDPLQTLLRLHLGWLRNWPWPLLVLLPVVAVAALWSALYPLLQRVGIVTAPQVPLHVLEQSLLLTLTLVMSLKYLLPVFLLLDLVASYVYLGVSPVWNFVGTTSRNILWPLKPLPLRLARVDLAPVFGTLLVLTLLHWMPSLVQSQLTKKNLPLWPQ